MSLATFFSFKHDKPIAHSHLWEQAAQGFVHGLIHQKFSPDKFPTKWDYYSYTLLMSGSALYSMAHNSFFKRHIEKVEYFRYAVLFAGTFNFLSACFCTNKSFFTDKASESNGFLKDFSIRLWKYTPSVLKIVNLAIIVLEAPERPMKVLSFLIGFGLSYRSS